MPPPSKVTSTEVGETTTPVTAKAETNVGAPIDHKNSGCCYQDGKNSFYFAHSFKIKIKFLIKYKLKNLSFRKGY
ncbi:hypothetical protein IID20_01685 [Patescibacteria group bacterium]|nr:hypothetical protein [Patescibacteria group bacterium]